MQMGRVSIKNEETSSSSLEYNREEKISFRDHRINTCHNIHFILC